MNLWIIIPVRPPGEGKSRLADVLSPPERRDLNERFLRHVLSAAAAIEECRTVVVSRSEAVRSIALSLGVEVIEERAAELNGALDEATSHAQSGGADAVLIVHADLPLLTTGDLRAMIEAAPAAPGMVIAGDRAASGTNALLVAPAGAMPYHFGVGSYAAHLAAAKSHGLTVVEADLPNLAFDIDTPDDLAAYRARMNRSV